MAETELYGELYGILVNAKLRGVHLISIVSYVYLLRMLLEIHNNLPTAQSFNMKNLATLKYVYFLKVNLSSLQCLYCFFLLQVYARLMVIFQHPLAYQANFMKTTELSISYCLYTRLKPSAK